MSRQDSPAKPKRRRHAAEFKRELVERCLQPGSSVSGIALDNGVNANVLFRWRREHLRANDGLTKAVLLPVEVAATTAGMTDKHGPVSLRSPIAAGTIEIDIGGAQVRLRGAVDEASVRCVLQALRSDA